MKDGAIDGMQTFDMELEKMIRAGTITRENGLVYSSNANNLALSISDLDGGAAPKPTDPGSAAKEKEGILGIEGFER